jgi:hypothetical protein
VSVRSVLCLPLLIAIGIAIYISCPAVQKQLACHDLSYTTNAATYSGWYGTGNMQCFIKEEGRWLPTESEGL